MPVDKSEKERSGTDLKNQKLWKGRYINPVKTRNESLSLLDRVQQSGYSRGAAYAELTAAGCSFLISENDDAMRYLSEAMIWFSENKNEPGYACALNLKSSLHESFGDYEKALQLSLQAYDLSVKTEDPEIRAETSSQLGLIYTRLCNFEKAAEFYSESLRIRQDMHDENAMASSLSRIGMVMRMTGKYEESLEYYLRSLAIRKRKKHSVSVPWTYLGIASTYEELNMPGEAMKFYSRGIAEGDKRCALQCLLGSGRIYSKTGEYEKSEASLVEAVQMARDLKALSLLADSYAALADLYESTGKFEKALENIRFYQKAAESLKSEQIQTRLRQVEISHAVEKSEQEKEIFRIRNIELKAAYDLVDEKNKYITASINYASRIQKAILPDPSEYFDSAGSYFILNQPREIVSGDFYWFNRSDKKMMVAVGDCTGHGVPGALLSMLGISFLEEIVNKRKITVSGKILDELKKEITGSLHQKGKKYEAKDGIDISLCIIDKKAKKLQFSGAYSTVCLVRNNYLTEYSGDKMTAGISDEMDSCFRSIDISIIPGDIIYMFTDGYADQLGGPHYRKFRYSGLKELLTGIHQYPFHQQKEMLENELRAWKGNKEQTDDILILSFKI